MKKKIGKKLLIMGLLTEKAKEIRKLMNQKKSNKGDLNNLDLNE